MRRTNSWNPTSNTNSSSSSQSVPVVITNMSVLSIRQSVDKPCPIKEGYTYQWYRSYSTKSVNRGKKRGDEEGEELLWYALPGATYATFQPSATDVGHFVRCVITVGTRIDCNEGHVEEEEEEEEWNMDDDSDSYFSFDNDDDEESTDQESVSSSLATTICESSVPISADRSLFNAARQNLLGGATFSNMRGCGYADGRIFRLKLELDYSSTKHGSGAGAVTSLLSIYQVSGEMAELMHSPEERIPNVTAIADSSQARSFDLLPPSGLLSSWTMISALSKNGRFQLQAPNRVTRESFLLSLGIANFEGRVCDLNVKTVLFSDPPPDTCSNQCQDDNIAKHRSLSGVDIQVDTKASQEERSIEDSIAAVDVDSTSEIVNSSRGTCLDGSVSERDDMSLCSMSRVRELELELQHYRKKLAAKDRVVSDLQRKLAHSDQKLCKAEKDLAASRSEEALSRAQNRECHTQLRLAEKRIETHESNLAIIKGDFSKQTQNHKAEMKNHTEKAAEYEKNIKSLQNEKAVLSAAVEARDNKLLHMSELQGAVVSLKLQVAKGDNVRRSLVSQHLIIFIIVSVYFNCLTSLLAFDVQVIANTKHAEIAAELEQAKASENECRAKLVDMKETVQQLNVTIAKEKQRSADLQSERDTILRKSQQLKTERNTFKNKSESLSKEMSRICRNGMGISDIEKMMEDQESMKTEVELLKKQKRSALDELQEYKNGYEHCLLIQNMTGMDGEAVRALEQRSEMERVISNLTEHINAKEMQVETLMEVNRALSEEVHKMAQANLGNNDV
uniref:Uncharacterized protein n=1 Tax=Ditylum brightwellii TaxID=49249 RepID=A0A7S4WDS9_9STRA